MSERGTDGSLSISPLTAKSTPELPSGQGPPLQGAFPLLAVGPSLSWDMTFPTSGPPWLGSFPITGGTAGKQWGGAHHSSSSALRGAKGSGPPTLTEPSMSMVSTKQPHLCWDRDTHPVKGASAFKELLKLMCMSVKDGEWHMVPEEHQVDVPSASLKQIKMHRC